MIKIFVFIVLSSILWSCNNTSKNEDSTSKKDRGEHEEVQFEKYISTLDKIPLPLKHNPLGELPELSKSFDRSVFEKYKHVWTSQPLGIYYIDDETVGIIDCSIGDWGLVPFLTTYDHEGNKIDSVGFYVKSGQDINYHATEYLTFKADRTISVTDTVRRYAMNADETDIDKETLKITTGKVEYEILKDGKIESVVHSDK